MNDKRNRIGQKQTGVICTLAAAQQHGDILQSSANIACCVITHKHQYLVRENSHCAEI